MAKFAAFLLLLLGSISLATASLPITIAPQCDWADSAIFYFSIELAHTRLTNPNHFKRRTVDGLQDTRVEDPIISRSWDPSLEVFLCNIVLTKPDESPWKSRKKINLLCGHNSPILEQKCLMAGRPPFVWLGGRDIGLCRDSVWSSYPGTGQYVSPEEERKAVDTMLDILAKIAVWVRKEDARERADRAWKGVTERIERVLYRARERARERADRAWKEKPVTERMERVLYRQAQELMEKIRLLPVQFEDWLSVRKQRWEEAKVT
ncbi:unnamed protein product [Zymoseptoria tritici ST99CH_1E4]|uniref:Uncharacterized protein n=1 Tax=Zymoseptoria tritici ST99CH_1E4 TaxID=1276532 RepID=A0A2H1FJG8_ZYMTR|nr:unnamed protein product [Zymoseptoria tritici ST99CH_1E4]